MKIQPDFSEASVPIVPGLYLCKIISAELKMGREKGTQYINWKLETQPGKLTVYHSTPIEGRGAGMFKHFVHCAGDPNYQSGEYDTDELINELVLMELDIKIYTNKNGQESKGFIVINVNKPSLEALDSLTTVTEDDLPF